VPRRRLSGWENGAQVATTPPKSATPTAQAIETSPAARRPLSAGKVRASIRIFNEHRYDKASVVIAEDTGAGQNRVAPKDRSGSRQPVSEWLYWM
jgi:hypothetical protein